MLGDLLNNDAGRLIRCFELSPSMSPILRVFHGSNAFAEDGKVNKAEVTIGKEPGDDSYSVLSLSGSPLSYYAHFLDQGHLNAMGVPKSQRPVAIMFPQRIFEQYRSKKYDLSKLMPKLMAWLTQTQLAPLPAAMKAYMLQRRDTVGGIREMPKCSLSARVVAYALSDACPSKDVSDMLLGATKLSDSAQKRSDAQRYIARKTGGYGVYFCNSDTLPGLRANFEATGSNLRVVVESFDALTIRQSRIEMIYQKILNHFSATQLIVYVRGLRIVDDQLLKWCCEHTNQVPWHFIYFEGAVSTYNYSENRDRCNFDFDDKSDGERTADDDHGVYNTHTIEKGRLVVGEIGHKRPLPPTLDDDWTSSAGETARRSCVLLIVSPPGAGKTYFVEHSLMSDLRKDGLICERFDCSSDILVQKALSQVLLDKIPYENRPTLLVADEYHILSREHKRELFEWCIPKLSWLRLVLVGNRHNGSSLKYNMQLTLTDVFGSPRPPAVR